jgi:hypothetical protein
MNSFIEPLYKAVDLIKFGWSRETGAITYNMYVGLTSGSLSSLYTGIPDVASKQPVGLGKVIYDATIEDVRTVLGQASTVDFGNKTFFFAITYVDSVGAESAIADSRVVEVFPVGLIPKTMKDDPTISRHGYVFSDDVLRWIKMAGTSAGALITSASDLYKDNITTEYTYDGTNLATTKSYLSDATTAGNPAKLTTYTYSGSDLIKTVVTDSTV